MTVAIAKRNRREETPPPPDPDIQEPRTPEHFEMLPVGRIQESPTNPRKNFTAKGLEELANSIRIKGVLQPILVRPRHAGDYELVAGARRLRASIAAGRETIPAIVRELTDGEVLEIQVIENDQREDVQPLDQAEGYKALIERAGYDVRSLAEKIGRSESYIYQRLQLTHLIDDAKKLLRDDKIHLGHASLIARLQPKDQAKLLKDYIFANIDYSGAPSVQRLRQKIESDFCLNLKSALFPKDDATLVASAGTCLACPKRTGSNPALWPEINKEDVCTDPACYRRKEQAFVQLQVKKAEQKDPDIIRISVRNGADTRSGILGYNSYEIISKKQAKELPAEQVKTAVVVDRDYWKKHKPGQVVHVRLTGRNSRNTPRSATPEEKAQREWADARRNWSQKAIKMVEAAAKASPLRLAALAILDLIPPFDQPWRMHGADLRKHAKIVEAIIRADLPAIEQLAAAAAKGKVTPYGLQDPLPELLSRLIEGWQVQNVPPMPALEDFLPEPKAKAKAKRKPAASEANAGATPQVRRCRVCGCTDVDCASCIEATGEFCHWVEDDLCSACTPEARTKRYEAAAEELGLVGKDKPTEAMYDALEAGCRHEEGQLPDLDAATAKALVRLDLASRDSDGGHSITIRGMRAIGRWNDAEDDEG